MSTIEKFISMVACTTFGILIEESINGKSDGYMIFYIAAAIFLSRIGDSK